MSLRPAGFSPQCRAFVSSHLSTESLHLALFDRLLDPQHKSRLLPLWRFAGFTLGFLPTVIGELARPGMVAQHPSPPPRDAAEAVHLTGLRPLAAAGWCGIVGGCRRRGGAVLHDRGGGGLRRGPLHAAGGDGQASRQLDPNRHGRKGQVGTARFARPCVCGQIVPLKQRGEVYVELRRLLEECCR